MKPRKSISELRAIVLQRRLRLACQAGRIMAGHECGIVRGPLPPLRRQGEPVRLDEMKHSIVKRTVTKHGGNKTAAAEELGISRNTVIEILRGHGQRKPYPPRNMIQLAQACAAFVVSLFLVGCKTSPVTPSDTTAHPLPPIPEFNSRAQMFTAGISAQKQKFLRWDGNADEYLVQTGPNRGQMTNSFRVSTNAVPYKNGVCYTISAIGPAGEFIGGALWPSNRLAEYRLRDNRGGDALLLRFTNSPPGVSRFWMVTNNPSAYIADITTGWQ